MLAKDPKKRPAYMRDVIDELDASLNDTLTFDFDTDVGEGAGERDGAPARAHHPAAGHGQRAATAGPAAAALLPPAASRPWYPRRPRTDPAPHRRR